MYAGSGREPAAIEMGQILQPFGLGPVIDCTIRRIAADAIQDAGHELGAAVLRESPGDLLWHPSTKNGSGSGDGSGSGSGSGYGSG